MVQSVATSQPSSQHLAVMKEDTDAAESDVKSEMKQEMFDDIKQEGGGGGKGDCSMVGSNSMPVFKSEGKHESCGKEVKLEDTADGKMEAHMKCEAGGDAVKLENDDKLDGSGVKSDDAKSNSLNSTEGGTTTVAVTHDSATPAVAGTHGSTTKPRCKKRKLCVCACVCDICSFSQLCLQMYAFVDCSSIYKCTIIDLQYTVNLA